MARPMPTFGPRRRRRSGQGSSPSSASARPGRSARPGGRSPSSAAARGSIPAEGATAGNLVVAYEPVWAIGTGLTPDRRPTWPRCTRAIRAELGELVGQARAGEVRILYGGSVKPSNAAELMAVANVDGALVGGASLVAADFLGIAAAYLG